MFPGQSLLSISNGSGTTAILYCDSINYQIVTEEFERTEYSHEKRLNALENSGVKSVTGTLLFGVPYQIASGGAVPTTARDFRPDDADLDNIYKKFFIQRYTIKGAESSNSDMANLYSWSIIHKTLQDRFTAHQKFASGNVSIQELDALKADTLAYLTNTGYSLTTESLGTLTNILIRNLDIGVAYSVNTPSGLLVLNDYTLTVDQVLIVPQSA